MDLADVRRLRRDPPVALYPARMIELLGDALRRRRRRRRCRHDRLRDPDRARPRAIIASIAARRRRHDAESFLASVGAAFLGFLAATGRLVDLCADGAGDGDLRPPFYPRLILRQMLDIGYYSLPVVGLTAIFTGMVLALQTYTGFSRFAAESAVATVVVLSVTRELGPVIAGLMVAGRVGAAMAAEIGTMRVTDQIDALTTLSTDPFRYLVLPRLVRRACHPAAAGRSSPTSSASSAAISSAPTSSASTRASYLGQHRAVSGDERCRLRPGQGRRCSASSSR